MSVSQAKIDFEARAVLRKLPSINGKHAQHGRWPDPYLVFDGRLGECIEQFLAKPKGQHHLYEIHTSAQADVVGEVMSSGQISTLVRHNGSPK